MRAGSSGLMRSGTVYAKTGGSSDAVAMKAVMGRVGRRVREVGLQLHNVRGRGYLLEVPREAAER